MCMFNIYSYGNPQKDGKAIGYYTLYNGTLPLYICWGCYMLIPDLATRAMEQVIPPPFCGQQWGVHHMILDDIGKVHTPMSGCLNHHFC